MSECTVCNSEMHKPRMQLTNKKPAGRVYLINLVCDECKERYAMERLEQQDKFYCGSLGVPYKVEA